MQHLPQTSYHAKHKNIVIFIVLIAVFVGPIIAAVTLYKNKHYLPNANVVGEFIQPPQALSNLELENTALNPVKLEEFKRQWLILYVTTNHCSQMCLSTLYKMQQIHQALGKNKKRVTLLLVTPEELNQTDVKLKKLLHRHFPSTQHLLATDETLASLMKDQETKRENSLFLVDPNALIILRYSPKDLPGGIFKDLKRLLMASQVG